MSRPSPWKKPKHFSGSETDKNFVGRGGVSGKAASGSENIVASKRGKRLARRVHHRK